MSNADSKCIDWDHLDGEIKSWEDTAKFVMADIKDRHAFGLHKYGTALSTNTKEDMLQHLYEELLDGAIYIKTLINQRKEEQSCKTSYGGCC